MTAEHRSHAQTELATVRESAAKNLADFVGYLGNPHAPHGKAREVGLRYLDDLRLIELITIELTGTIG